MQRRVTFKSDGIEIAGVLYIPDGHGNWGQPPFFNRTFPFVCHRKKMVAVPNFT